MSIFEIRTSLTTKYMPETSDSISVSNLISLYGNSLSSALDGELVIFEGFF